eukprot:536901_1
MNDYTINLPGDGICCPSLEHFLLNNRICSIICGIVLYLPIMFLLFIIWIIQIPITIIINLLCFNFNCCKQYMISKVNHQDQQLLQLYTNIDQNNIKLQIKKHTKSNTESKQYFTLVQWNLFGQLGRYWKRYPLWTKTLYELQPDIICVQEAITLKLMPCSTIKTIQKK